MENLIEIAISNGIFAVLFVYLLFYTLKDSRAREDKYLDVIDKLSQQFEILEEVQQDVQEIKNVISGENPKKDDR